MNENETDTPIVMLTEHELALINGVRAILHELPGRLPIDTADRGRIDALADAASDDLFRLLNHSTSYRVQQITDYQLHEQVKELRAHVGNMRLSVDVGPGALGAS
jgi:hypothetical protein